MERSPRPRNTNNQQNSSPLGRLGLYAALFATSMLAITGCKGKTGGSNNPKITWHDSNRELPKSPLKVMSIPPVNPAQRTSPTPPPTSMPTSPNNFPCAPSLLDNLTILTAKAQEQGCLSPRDKASLKETRDDLGKNCNPLDNNPIKAEEGAEVEQILIEKKQDMDRALNSPDCK